MNMPPSQNILRNIKAKRSEKSASDRSFEYYENLGLFTADVESAIRGTFFKKDLLGMFDGLAFGFNLCIGFQSTVIEKHKTRINKIINNPMSFVWLTAGLQIEVISWADAGYRLTKIGLEDIPQETLQKALTTQRYK